jgi:hypothetical protein
MTAADFNGDGRLDLVVADRSGPTGGGIGNALVFLNDGRGRFGTAQRFPGGPITHSVETADLDLDGDLDIAVAIFLRQPNDPNDPDRIMLLVNDGRGAFTEQNVLFNVEPSTWRGSAYPGLTFAALTDWDGDGDPDLAVSIRFCDQIALLQNRLGSRRVEVPAGKIVPRVDFGAARWPAR